MWVCAALDAGISAAVALFFAATLELSTRRLMLPAGMLWCTVLGGHAAALLGQREKSRPLWFAAWAAAAAWMVIGGIGLSVGFAIYWLDLASVETAVSYTATAAICGFIFSTFIFFYALRRVPPIAAGKT